MYILYLTWEGRLRQENFVKLMAILRYIMSSVQPDIQCETQFEKSRGKISKIQCKYSHF